MSSRVDEIEKRPEFVAYNQAIEDALAAIRGERVDDPYAAATFINAIARKCSPHVYVNRLATTPTESAATELAGERAREVFDAGFAAPATLVAQPLCNHERELGKKVIGCFDCYPPNLRVPSTAAQEAQRKVIVDLSNSNVTSWRTCYDRISSTVPYSDEKPLRDEIAHANRVIEILYRDLNSLAAIVSKHCGGQEANIDYKTLYEAGVKTWNPVYEQILNERDELRAEVSRLNSEVERLRELVYVPKILPDDEALIYRDHAGNLLRRNIELKERIDTARADAIGECVEVVKRRHPQVLGEIPEADSMAWSAARNYLEAAHESLIVALEQRKEEGGRGAC